MSDKRVCVVNIAIRDRQGRVQEVNSLLAEYGEYVRGRLGLPLKEEGVNIISVVLAADTDVLGALSGKLGQIKGIQVKTLTL